MGASYTPNAIMGGFDRNGNVDTNDPANAIMGNFHRNRDVGSGNSADA